MTSALQAMARADGCFQRPPMGCVRLRVVFDSGLCSTQARKAKGGTAPVVTDRALI
jgi:hypothetical protein